MKRQQLTERNEFDYADKYDLLNKTNFKCGHCGEQLYVGENATLDHYIPLSKGGINQRLNIIPLCEDCNRKKDSKIISPDWYLRYIDPAAKKQVSDYFLSYVQSFDFLTRGNLLSCDVYEIRMYTGTLGNVRKGKKTARLKEKASKSFYLERVRHNGDESKEATDFFIRYLRKYNLLENEAEARMNMEFWQTFGAVYCMRDPKTGEIRNIVPITMCVPDDQRPLMQIHIFSMSATDMSAQLVANIPRFFAGVICDEHGMDELRYLIYTPLADRAARYLIEDCPHGVSNGFFRCTKVVFQNTEGEIDPEKQKKAEEKFCACFHNVRKYLDAFFAKPGYERIRFMGELVLPGYADEAPEINQKKENCHVPA